MLGAKASRGGSRQPSNAGMELGDGSIPGGGLYAFPGSGGPPGPDALEEGGGHPKGDPKVGGAGGTNSRAEGRKGKGFAPELDAGGRDDSSLDGTNAGDAHDGCP